MVNKEKKKTQKKEEKIQKNTELVSIMASTIESMSPGERVRITPFAKSMILSNGSHPHVETVKIKLMESYLWQDISKDVKFTVKDNQIVEIEKLNREEESPNDTLIRKEIRDNLNSLTNQFDNMQNKLDKLNKTVDEFHKKLLKK